MRRGQSIKLELLNSKTSDFERQNVQGLHPSETYYGELYSDVQIDRQIILTSIVTSNVQKIEPLSPVRFKIHTMHSVYLLTLEPNGRKSGSA